MRKVTSNRIYLYRCNGAKAYSESHQNDRKVFWWRVASFQDRSTNQKVGDERTLNENSHERHINAWSDWYKQIHRKQAKKQTYWMHCNNGLHFFLILGVGVASTLVKWNYSANQSKWLEISIFRNKFLKVLLLQNFALSNFFVWIFSLILRNRHAETHMHSTVDATVNTPVLKLHKIENVV